jgi:hypothetical protein
VYTSTILTKLFINKLESNFCRKKITNGLYTYKPKEILPKKSKKAFSKLIMGLGLCIWLKINSTVTMATIS